jgi:hypothetical protein
MTANRSSAVMQQREKRPIMPRRAMLRALAVGDRPLLSAPARILLWTHLREHTAGHGHLCARVRFMRDVYRHYDLGEHQPQ